MGHCTSFLPIFPQVYSEFLTWWNTFKHVLRKSYQGASIWVLPIKCTLTILSFWLYSMFILLIIYGAPKSANFPHANTELLCCNQIQSIVKVAKYIFLNHCYCKLYLKYIVCWISCFIHKRETCNAMIKWFCV